MDEGRARGIAPALRDPHQQKESIPSLSLSLCGAATTLIFIVDGADAVGSFVFDTSSTGRFQGDRVISDIRLVKLKMQIRNASHYNHLLLKRSVSVWMHNLVVPSLRTVKTRLGRTTSSNVFDAMLNSKVTAFHQ